MSTALQGVLVLLTSLLDLSDAENPVPCDSTLKF